MKKLLIYVPTYNRFESLKLCVQRIIIQMEGLEDDVLIHISDNHSTDSTHEFLNSINHPNITISRNSTNIGGALNVLKIHTLNNLAQYSLIIGDDDYLVDGSIKKIVSYLKSNSDVDIFFINTLSYPENSKSSVIKVLNENNWRNFPHGGNIKSKINKDFRCTFSDLFNPSIDEVFGGSLMCYIFKSHLISNHLNNNISTSDSGTIYSSYPHTLNWIYSLLPTSNAAFIHLPFTINFWHEGKEWGNLGYHKVVSQGLGFLFFELLRLKYITKENANNYFNHYLNIASTSINILIKMDLENSTNDLSPIFKNLLIDHLLKQRAGNF